MNKFVLIILCFFSNYAPQTPLGKFQVTRKKFEQSRLECITKMKNLKIVFLQSKRLPSARRVAVHAEFARRRGSSAAAGHVVQ